MKKILFIIAFLISLGAYSQAYSKYQRLGKLTTAQRNTIDVSDTSVIYTCYNTTTNQEEINTGSGWVARISGAGGPYYFSGLLGNARDNTDLDSELDLLIPNAGATTISGSKTFSSVQKFIAGLEANGSFEFSASGLPTYPNLNAFYLKPSSDYSGVKIQTGAGSTTVEDKMKFFNVHGNTYTGNPNNLIAEFYGRVKVGEPTASTDASTKGYVDVAISSNILDEDNMASNSATKVPSQQSVKAYVDTKAGLAISNTFTAGQRFNGTNNYFKSSTGTPVMIENIAASNSMSFSWPTESTFHIDPSGSGNSFYYNFDTSQWILPTNTTLQTSIPTLSGQPASKLYVDTALSNTGTSEVAERSLNAGKYHFTSTASNETLTSALVEPATPNLGKKMWRTYTANDTITVPGNLPVGWSSVIEAGSATDSILIKADTGVDIYGQGNSFVQSGTGIDGLWLKKGRTVALVYKGTNSVRAEGPWNVANLAPTQYNTILNAAGPGVYETNSTTGITMSGGGKGTWTSIASDSGSDAYMLNFAQNTIAGDIFEYLNFTGIPTGIPLTVEVDVAGIGSPNNAEIDLETSKGWTVSQFLSIVGNTRVTKTFTATANSATPSITLYDDTLVSGQGWKIYEVRITIAP